VDEIAISEAAEDEIAISEAAWAGDGVHGCKGANDAGWTGTVGGGARGDAFGRASGAGASATAHAERALGGAATATLAGALSRRARVAVGRVLGAAAACEAGADVGRVPVLTEAAAGATYAAPARLVIDSEADDEIAISEAEDEPSGWPSRRDGSQLGRTPKLPALPWPSAGEWAGPPPLLANLPVAAATARPESPSPASS